MSSGSININNIRQEFTVAVNEITGYGNSESPFLLIPISFSFIPYRGGNNSPYTEFELLNLSAELYLTSKNFKAAEIFTPQNFKIYQPNNYQTTMRFPLNRDTIFQIEKYREGTLPASLIFKLQIAKYNIFPIRKEPNTITSSYVNGFELTQGHTTFSIEQSQWISKIIPGFGYKTANLIELPTSSMILPVEYENSMTEIEESRKYFLAGDYDKAVGHCRAAIEPFKNNLQQLKESITSKSEHEWIKRNLVASCNYIDAVLGATYAITNKSHHPPSIGNFGRNEAEIILNMTILILAYIGKIKP